MAHWQHVDPGKETLPQLRRVEHNRTNDVRFIEPLKDPRQSQQPLGHGRQGEELIALVVKQWPLASMVTGGEELLSLRRPYSEGKRAQNVIEALRPPSFPGCQEKARIRQRFCLDQVQLVDQV